MKDAIATAMTTLEQLYSVDVTDRENRFPALLDTVQAGVNTVEGLISKLSAEGIELDVEKGIYSIGMDVHGEHKIVSLATWEYYHDSVPLLHKMEDALEALSDMIDYAESQLIKAQKKEVN